MSPDFFKELLRTADTEDVKFHDLAAQFYYGCKVRNLSPNTLRGCGERFAGRVLMGKVEVSPNGHKAGEKPAFFSF